MSAPYVGLTWDHPRGRNALEFLAGKARREGRLSLEWHVQPLEGFESASVAENSAKYDLLVLDHPHLGEAVAADCLTPINELFSAGLLRDWRRNTVGESFASYELGGACWALPLDAAAQVMAFDGSRLGDAPVTWSEVAALAQRQPVAIVLAGPHAILALFSICAALGAPAATDCQAERLFDPAAAAEALAMIRNLHRLAPEGCIALNPFQVLDAISAGDLSCSPLVYGYVNYSRPRGAGKRAVRFTNAPVMWPGGPLGSTLGGTGIAVTRRCKPDKALLDHLDNLMTAETQISVVAAHDGQPSRIEAWTDEDVNRNWSHFYRNTLATIQAAWVRPRWNGYMRFQRLGSEIVRDFADSNSHPEATVERLERLALDLRLGRILDEVHRSAEVTVQ